MALAGLKTMLAGALRDRVVAVAGVAVAVFLLLTAWILAVTALVLFLVPRLGPVGALLAVAGGLVAVAILLVWGMGARNRRTAELRASTRALWTATAVNLATSALRGGEAATEAGGGQQTSGKTRKVLLVAGGLALMLLALLFPSGKDKGQDSAGPDAPGPGPDGTV